MMIAPLPFDQVDVVLCEDRRTVLLHGYAGDALFLQSVCEAVTDLDPDTVERTGADQWRRKAKPDRWIKT
ncbi:hypothetical protein CIT25_16125 [Mesorhizobium mediterraneum]|uniref:Uncharacterized protein n=2 Tax=Mesorhizobium mediterraneum TaxID=43617 RepID=A0AB36RBE2_9HYPH|nr:hypothetical protein CIT25_16125 [Mesorhizobium mediterraneum]